MATANENATNVLKVIAGRSETRVFAIDAATGRSWTFSQWHHEATQFGARLSQLGLQPGERLGVMADNGPTVGLLYFGALYAGVSVVPIHPTSSPDEVGFIAQLSRLKHLVFSDEYLTLAGSEPVAATGVGLLPLNELARAATKTGFIALETASLDDELVVVFTSGTTAQPKGVSHRLRDLLDNARLFGQMVGLGPENRFLNLLPMTYLGGYYNLLLLPYFNECSVVFAPAFGAANAATFWQTVKAHEVNTLWLVPSIMSMLLRLDRGTTGEDYARRSVKFSLCGTAPLSPDLRDRFESRYGIGVFENYGLSETLFLSVNSPEDDRARHDTGAIVPGVELRVVDREGKAVPPGADGEILARTPSLMKGYLDGAGFLLPEEGGFFPTGDLGRVVEGRLEITGRKKDLIIRGGVNISPASVETVIAAVAGVQDVAVVGVAHPIMGEEIVAVLQLTAGQPFESIRLRVAEACSKKLARLRQPSTIVELPEFPRTTSGKVQKEKLRSWLAHGSKPKDPADPMSSALLPPPPLPATTDGPRSLKPSRVVTDVIEAMSIKYNNRVYELKESGVDVTVLSLGEAFFDIPLFGFDDLPYPALYHYSHSRGTPGLRKRLADYFAAEYGVDFDPQTEIIVTAGSKIAIYMTLLATIDPGDEVLVPEPAWVSYFEQIKLCHGKPVGIPFDQELYDFEKFITPRTRCIIINNPNNPRGRVYSLAELSHLHRLAVKHNLHILSDEAYSDFLLESQRFVSMANLDTKKSHTVVVNSISKNFGISGWRLGYLITNPELTNQVLKINQHLITCPATILEHYVEKHFSEIIAITTPQMRAVVERRARVATEMARLGLTALDGDSTFYFLVSLGSSRLSSEAFCDELLARDRVCAVPGIGYGASCDRFVRVSVGSESEERIFNGLRALQGLIERTS